MHSDETIAPGDDPAVPPGGGAPGSGGAERWAVAGALERPGDEVGPYKLVSAIGEGGFGTVWLAERRRPFTQRVALKIIKPGMDSKAVVARFEQERQALAVMNHPGIAKVLDGGLTPSGRPYFAMEYVKGEPITEFCDRQKLSIKQRLQLFTQVCEAVQHAHTKGIIHRDLKSGNVLVAIGDGSGPQAKVIDFGVAKALTQRMTEQTIFTETGQMIGTPSYMSPEQAEPDANDIDTRSDVYSLGVMLYELLTGALPFDPQELRSKAYREVQRIIREEDPPTPSARLSTIATKDTALASKIAEARKDAAANLSRLLKTELEWIPLKAMRKERRERYDSPADLARDVQNYLEGRPLVAAPESTAYRVRKYVRRNRGFVAAASTVLAALVVGLGLATWQWRAAVVARRGAEDLLGVMATSTALDAIRLNDVVTAKQELATARSVGHDDRFAARLADALSDASIASFPCTHPGMAGITFSSDGRTLASAGRDRTILWDVMNGREIGIALPGCDPCALALSPDGRTLAIAERNRKFQLWDMNSGKASGLPLQGHDGEVYSAVFSPDGRIVASAGLQDGAICLWDAKDGIMHGEPLRGHLPGGSIKLGFGHDGGMLASGGADGTIRLWDVATGSLIREPIYAEGQMFSAVAVSPDKRTIASGTNEGEIHLWDMVTGKQIGRPLLGHEAPIYSIAFSIDGRTLVSGSNDTTIRLWNVATGTAIGAPLRGHETGVHFVLMPDGRTIASVGGGEDEPVRLWDIEIARTLAEPRRGHERRISSIAFSPDGRTLASGTSEGTIRLWDAATGMAIGEPLRRNRYPVNRIAFGADGKTIVSVDCNGTAQLWDASSGNAIGEPVRGHDGVLSAISPDGRTLASAGGDDGALHLWDRVTGERIGEPLGRHRLIYDLEFSPNGRTVAIAGPEGVTLRDTITGEPLDQTPEVDWCSSVAFSTDGTILAIAHDGISLWNLDTSDMLGQRLDGFAKGTSNLAISPDGRTLATSNHDGTIRLWDIATGKPIGEPLLKEVRDNRSLASHTEITFSPDGRALASGSEDGTVRLWIAVPMRERIGAIRETLSKVELVRTLLADLISRTGESEEEVAHLQSAVLADARFMGELRRPALIVAGEVSLDREAKRIRRRAELDARMKPLRQALDAGDVSAALMFFATLTDEDRSNTDPHTIAQLCSRGLSELPAGSPARDLRTLLRYAERAVELTKRPDGSALDTLARAHWELGDKPKALAVQAEAIKAQEARIAATNNAKAREFLGDALTQLRDTLARYEREAPPAPPAAK